ncbi:MAG TPA: type II toxin-antitoxin system MqsR family toxin [Gemmatimonadales bacterium]
MPRWLPRTLARVRRLAAEGRVRFTLKALREMRALDLDADDAVEVLRGLAAGDSAGRLASTATAEWMYVFKPRIAEATLYLKLVVRTDCVVVSFHEETEE